MIKKLGNKIEINRSIELTPKHNYRISLLSKTDQEKYVLSLMGLSRSTLSIPKCYGHDDKLQVKHRNTVMRILDTRLINESDTFYQPLIRTKDSQYVGVEIECLFDDDGSCDDDDSCEFCGGSGEETCYNCEGRGNVTATDSNGNEYEVECSSCDGNGVRDCSECDGRVSHGSGGIRDKIRSKLRQAHITCCSVKSDGSLEGDGKIGVEITVLFDVKHGFEKLTKLCAILNKMGASVNETCGLHVHIDQHGSRKSDVINLGEKFGQFLPILSKLIPSSRRANRFCKLGVSGIDSGDDRYYAVNLTAFSKHKTIEIRLHSGTTNAEKIINWIKLLLAIKNCKTRSIPRIRTFQAMIDILKLREPLVEYLDRRMMKFNPDLRHDNMDQIDIPDDETSGDDDLSVEIGA